LSGGIEFGTAVQGVNDSHMTRILILHGPNLNCLSRREKGYYGSQSLEDINETIRTVAVEQDIEIEIIQSNDESRIVEAIQTAENSCDGIILNPAGFGYTSIAIRDAVILAGIPVVEVHISNIHARESFRRRSVIAPVCIGQISGFKALSYCLGLQAILDHINSKGGSND
jgi:3-dehydroquinate dehydratase II